MDSSVKIFCFGASYFVALVLELPGPWTAARWRRAASMLAASLGIIAQTWYLGNRAAAVPSAPLASHHDWLLLAAWLLAAINVGALFYYPQKTLGIFLLPAVLALIGMACYAAKEPLASFEAPRVWGLTHGMFLLLGTIAVLLGFLSGLMYLLQSRRIKQKRPVGKGLLLPSLEWLERLNSRALGIAALCVGGGFLTGVITQLSRENALPWTDPVVLSLGAMLVWLVVAEVFRMIYPAARQGRKVAYLTIAAFVFLLLVLSTMTWQDSLHGTGGESQQASRSSASCIVSPAMAPRILAVGRKPSGIRCLIDRRACALPLHDGSWLGFTSSVGGAA